MASPGRSKGLDGSTPREGGLRATLRKPEVELIAPPPTAFAAIGAHEIFGELESVRYVIETLDMCPGAPTMWAGYGFSAKTVSAQAAAIAIAGGLGRVWGCYAAPRGRVLHIDYEQGSRLTRQRYQRLAMPHLLGSDDLQGHLALSTMPTTYLDDASAESELAKTADGYDLVLIDSLRAAAPSLDENSSDVRRVLDMLGRVSERTGAAVLVIHHARKPNQNAVGGAKMAIRGSGALFDACASVLVFEAADKNQPIRVTHEKARTSGTLADDFELEVTDVPDGANPRAGLIVAATSACRASQQSGNQRVDEMKERVRAHLREHGEASGRKPLRARLNVNRDVLYAALDEMEASGEVENVGTKQRPRLRLAEVASE